MFHANNEVRAVSGGKGCIVSVYSILKVSIPPAQVISGTYKKKKRM